MVSKNKEAKNNLCLRVLVCKIKCDDVNLTDEKLCLLKNVGVKLFGVQCHGRNCMDLPMPSEKNEKSLNFTGYIQLNLPLTKQKPPSAKAKDCCLLIWFNLLQELQKITLQKKIA